MQERVHTDTPGVGLRVGLECGEPIADEDGDLYGTCVVVARRLCDLASSGQIYITELVRGLIGDQIDLPLSRLGPTQVKGLTAPVATWLVHWADLAAPGGASPPSTIGVLIADDQRLVRAGFRVILESEPDIRVVGEAGDGLEALEAVRKLAPHVVLMDIRMPNMNGLEAAAQLLATTSTHVVILTTFDADEYVYETLRIGASGFLLKDCPPEQLVTAVRAAAAGDALIDPAVTRRVISRFAEGRVQLAESQPDPSTSWGLTAREADVLRLVARGLSNAEIAAELVVEETTVKTHVARILAKLGVRDRVQAVVYAYESGFTGR
jgi:DNA-binding NarL/FixJ family response regulator